MRRLAILALVTSTAYAEKTYTLADLDKLVADGAYQEAFSHVGDIPPAQRSTAWTEVAATAAAGVLATLPADDGSTLGFVDAVNRQYPQLMKSAKYTKPRGELGLAGVTGCYATAERGDCLKIATRFAGTDRALVIGVARTTVEHADAAEAAPLFKRVLDNKLCGDPAVHRATVGGLDRPPDSAAAIDARAITTTCWDTSEKLRDAVVKAFDESGKASDLHKNACPILAARHMLSSLQTKRCK